MKTSSDVHLSMATAPARDAIDRIGAEFIGLNAEFIRACIDFIRASAEFIRT